MFVGASFKNEEYSHTICACLFVLDSSLDWSGKKKSWTWLDSLFLDPVEKYLGEVTSYSGRNESGRTGHRAKRAYTPC